jgi:hypothetical protein
MADAPHSYPEDSATLTDARADAPKIAKLPNAPEGAKIARVDLVIRFRRAASDEEVVQRIHHSRLVEFAFDPDSQGFFCVFVDDVQLAVNPRLMKAFLYEVAGPMAYVAGVNLSARGLSNPSHGSATVSWITRR